MAAAAWQAPRGVCQGHCTWARTRPSSASTGLVLAAVHPSSVQGCLQVPIVIVFMSLLKQIVENVDPGIALDYGTQSIRPACGAVSLL